MAKRKTRSRRKRAKRFLWIITGIMAAITSCMAVFMLISAKKEVNITKPDELLVTYMSYIQEKKYEEMYQMIDAETSGQISEEDFTKRNSAIYEGIEIQNMTTTVISYDEEKNVVQYQTAFDTVAGNITFENEAFFLKREDGYKLMWTDSLIYPGLSSTDKSGFPLRRQKGEKFWTEMNVSLRDRGLHLPLGLCRESWKTEIAQSNRLRIC